MRTLFLALLLAFLVLPAVAQDAREDMLVTTDWLEKNLASVKVLHVGDRAGYDAGHIPGAVLVELSSLVVAREEIPNELPPVETLAGVFRAAGVGQEGRIVLYSPDAVLAERAWFTLDYLGHGERAAILDGGLKKWTAEKRALSTEGTAANAAEFVPRPRPAIVTSLAAMRDVVAQSDSALNLKFVLLDSRPPEQFEKPGHIPGALNIPAGAHFRDGVLRPAAELRALYEQAGVTKETGNVAYCRSGMQSSVTYFVLKYLGYDATVYDGSYAEWSKAGEKPE